MGQEFSSSAQHLNSSDDFSLSDENLNILYEGTATKGASKSITQDGWTITVTNLGLKESGKHLLYSMTVMVNGSQYESELTTSVRTSLKERDVKAKLRNEINLRINFLTLKAESKKDGLPLKLKL